MNSQKVRGMLALKTANLGQMAAFARQHQISRGYLGDVLTGRREPGQKILDALGLERVVTYRRKKDV